MSLLLWDSFGVTVVVEANPSNWQQTTATPHYLADQLTASVDANVSTWVQGDTHALRRFPEHRSSSVDVTRQRRRMSGVPSTHRIAPTRRPKRFVS